MNNFSFSCVPALMTGLITGILFTLSIAVTAGIKPGSMKAVLEIAGSGFAAGVLTCGLIAVGIFSYKIKCKKEVSI